MTTEKKPVILSRRQPDGSYRVSVSDGAQHHYVGEVSCEWSKGPKNGRVRRWLPRPSEGAMPEDRQHPATLGEARRWLVQLWQERRERGASHGLPGVLLVVEGQDGSGKSTLAGRLAEALRTEGHEVLLTCEPSEGPEGLLLRMELRAPRLPPPGMALLFAADRTRHVATQVLPALERGLVVVCDRYTLSSLAYQGPACGLEWVAHLNRHAAQPDAWLILEVSAEVARERLAARGMRDSYDDESRQDESRRGYLRALAHLQSTPEGRRVHMLDADRPAEEVLAQALEVVRPLLHGREVAHGA